MLTLWRVAFANQLNLAYYLHKSVTYSESFIHSSQSLVTYEKNINT